MNKDTILKIVSILIVVSAIAGVIWYEKGRNEIPDKTVEKILELKSIPGKESELKTYFTNDFAKKPKMSSEMINTVVHKLRVTKKGKTPEVVFEVQTADDKGVKYIPAAQFFLKKASGKYLLSDVKMINPMLSNTIYNIVPKKDEQKVKLGEVLEISGAGLKINKINRESKVVENYDEPEMASYKIDLTVAKKPGKSEVLFLSLEAGGQRVSSYINIDPNDPKSANTSFSLNCFSSSCKADSLRIFAGDSEKDYIVSL